MKNLISSILIALFFSGGLAVWLTYFHIDFPMMHSDRGGFQMTTPSLTPSTEMERVAPLLLSTPMPPVLNPLGVMTPQPDNYIHGMGANLEASHVLQVPTNYPKIQSAIDAAKAGDTVKVAEGIYCEHIFLKNGVILTGDGEDKSVIRPDSVYRTGGQDQILTVDSCRSGVVSDLCFDDHNNRLGGIEVWDFPGTNTLLYTIPHATIRLRSSSIKLIRCRVYGGKHPESIGILSEKNDQSLVQDNDVTKCHLGIAFDITAKPTLLHNQGIVHKLESAVHEDQ